MTIGIDISQIVYEGTGVGRFTYGLVQAILDNNTSHKWVFFSSLLRQQLPQELVDNIKQKGHSLVQIPFPPTVLSLMWNEFHLMNVESFTGKLDWFISSDWTEPPAKCKKATIIHDLVFKRFPETVDEKIRNTQEKRLQHVRKESSLIIADSHATKNDIEELLQIASEKVHVVYPGVTVTAPTETQIQDVIQKLNITNPFILTVGKVEPRKNIAKLIEAYLEVKKTHPDIPKLYIVGPQGWGDLQFPQDKKIQFLGHITDQELYALYTSCLFFILPSIYEGFGYPVIEAMSLGAPVTVSDTSSLSELGKDSSLFFDPHEVNSIKNALVTMINNEALRTELIQKGKTKAQQFTWKAYYNQLISLLESK